VLNTRYVHPRFRRPIRTPAERSGGHGPTRGRDEAGGRGGEEQGEVRELQPTLQTSRHFAYTSNATRAAWRRTRRIQANESVVGRQLRFSATGRRLRHGMTTAERARVWMSIAYTPIEGESASASPTQLRPYSYVPFYRSLTTRLSVLRLAAALSFGDKSHSNASLSLTSLQLSHTHTSESVHETPLMNS
jgi:hypothetical protein